MNPTPEVKTAVPEAAPAYCPTCGQLIPVAKAADTAAIAADVAPLLKAVAEAHLVPTESPAHADPTVAVDAKTEYKAKIAAHADATKALADRIADVEAKYGPASPEANEVRRLANMAHYVKVSPVTESAPAPAAAPPPLPAAPPEAAPGSSVPGEL